MITSGHIAAFAEGCGINSGYLPGVVQRVQENAAGNVFMPIAVAILIAFFNAAVPEEFFFRYWLQTASSNASGDSSRPPAPLCCSRPRTSLRATSSHPGTKEVPEIWAPSWWVPASPYCLPA